MESFKNFLKATALTVGMAALGGEKLSAQTPANNDAEKIPVPEMQNDYKPSEVFEEYGIEKHPEWLNQQGTDEDTKTPYFKRLEEIKQARPDLDPLNYLDKDTFVNTYIQTMDSFGTTKEGHKEVDFKNAFYQGKKQFFLEELDKYAKDPSSFRGAIMPHDDLYLNSVFNKGAYGPEELDQYLDELRRAVDLIDERRVYETLTADELRDQAERLWETKGKGL